MNKRHRQGLGLMMAVIVALVMYMADTPLVVYVVFMIFAMIGLALLMSD